MPKRVIRRLASIPGHSSFYQAKKRCTNPNYHEYKYYGGRGIEFRFASFQQMLDEIGERPEGTTLERIDVNGHYEPGNVKWATDFDQRRNRRDNRWLEYKGERKILADWATEFGHSTLVVWKRLNRGWSVERALETPNLRDAGRSA